MSDRSNLIDTIAQHDKFSTFTRLLKSSGSTEIFSEGQFTVLAPTNDAFAKIPEAKINELVNETGQAKLKSLLSYHILPGKVMAASLTAAPTRQTLTGDELTFTESNGIKVNGASVQARNMEATNGVVHAVDTILTPSKMQTLTPAPIAAAATPTGTSLFSAVPSTKGAVAPELSPASAGASLSIVPPPATSKDN